MSRRLFPNSLAAVIACCVACSSASTTDVGQNGAGGAAGSTVSSGSGGTTASSTSSTAGGGATGGTATSGAGGGPSNDAGVVETGTLDSGGPTPDASTNGVPLATREEYLKTLYAFDDLLLSTQINRAGDANDGALVSPSTNPDLHPIHPRAAEAVYPFAVAYKYGHDVKYAAAAVRLGNWLVGLQNAAGAWIEEWPATTGWDGTSADQLISLAGAYSILGARLSAAENTAWAGAITKCADWIVANFPKGNINYAPTGAVALVVASSAIASPKPTWLAKAQSLMDMTLQSVNADGFITGEGMGVDLGYNIAQSIGMIAMYGKLLPSAMHVDRAAELMKSHVYFMYPNGAIDNSWGTRSFKWTLESGTKTAPGIFFSFALLADKDPSLLRGAGLALSFLRNHALDDQGWIAYGPNASTHASSHPPSNYATFARAQSLAVAVELGASAMTPGTVPADAKNWFHFFPTVATGVARTDKIMATVTAYGADATYPRESMARGGSVSALWFEGYGSTGFMQVSSPTVYARTEPLHMPIEQTLLPLTPRVETISGTYYANVLDDQAKLAMTGAADGIHATATGALRSVAGTASATTFSWSYVFGAASYTKELVVSSPANLRIVEPFVNNAGTVFELVGTDTFRITTVDRHEWQLRIDSSSGPYQLALGQNLAQYWAPFPGIECYPLAIRIDGAGSGSYSIRYTVSQTR